MNGNSLCFPSLEDRNNSRSLAKTSLKAFDYFIETFHFFLQSYIKHTLFMEKLFALASELRLKTNVFFDLPPILIVAGGIFDAFFIFLSPFFSLFFCSPQCVSGPLPPHATDSFTFLIHARRRMDVDSDVRPRL